ncbi:TPA: helix-turn-helix transcriptional regulator [Pseudomonas putida]|nr:helix-turn-helix transcriptional regulator [Pseudomonas putida]
MELKEAFGVALRQARLAKGFAQEALAPSQAYVSEVENGRKSPSIDKVDELATVLGVHPVTLFARSYLVNDGNLVDLLERVTRELYELE